MYNSGISVECTVSLDKRLLRYFVRDGLNMIYEDYGGLDLVGGWGPLKHHYGDELLLGVF